MNIDKIRSYLQPMPYAIWERRMNRMMAYRNYVIASIRVKFEKSMKSKLWNIIHFHTFNMMEFMHEWPNAFLWPDDALDAYLRYKGYINNDYMYDILHKDIDMKGAMKLERTINNYYEKHRVDISTKRYINYLDNRNRAKYISRQLVEALNRFNYVDTDILSDEKITMSEAEKYLLKTMLNLNSAYGI